MNKINAMLAKITPCKGSAKNWVLGIFLLVFSFSCQKEEAKFSIERKSFITNSRNSDLKAAYANLRYEQKRDLWLSKLIQVRENELPTETQELISKLYDIVKASKSELELLQNKEFSDIAVRLAETTSKSAYIQMFGKLQDYHVSVNDFKDIDRDFAEKQKNYFQNPSNFTNNISSKSKTEKESCNCRWDCRDWATTECEATSIGCGFFWVMSCTGRD